MPARDEMDNKRGMRRCNWCCWRSSNVHAHHQYTNPNSTSSNSKCNWLWIARTLFVCSLVAFFVWSVMAWSDIKSQFRACLAWVDQLGMFYGSLVLCCANIIGAILFLPCLPFTLASGFLYGTFFGTILVSIASTLAAVFSFIIARYLARKLVETRLGSKGSRFRLIDNAINKDGFRIVFLIRSSPIHPYGLCNYLFGLTSITLRDYTVASFIAMLPATICEVYFGTAMKTVADIISGNLQDGLLSRVFFWGGLAVTLLVTITVTLWLKEKLKTELDKYEEVAETDSDAPQPRDTNVTVNGGNNNNGNSININGGLMSSSNNDVHAVPSSMFVSADRAADLREQRDRERTPFLLDNKKLSTSPHGGMNQTSGSVAYISFSSMLTQPSSSSTTGTTSVMMPATTVTSSTPSSAVDLARALRVSSSP